MPDAQTKPRFLESFSELLENLRLGGLTTIEQSDGRLIVEQCLQQAQGQMIATLGFERITELAAIPYDPNPTTEDSYQRQLIRTVEIQLTLSFAIERIRLRMLEDTSGSRADWQHEPPMVDLSAQQLGNLQAGAQSTAKEAMEYLGGKLSLEDTAGDDATRVTTFGYSERTGIDIPSPGGTVFHPYYRNPDVPYGATPFDQ